MYYCIPFACISKHWKQNKLLTHNFQEKLCQISNRIVQQTYFGKSFLCQGENDLEEKPKWEIYNQSALASYIKRKIQPLVSTEILCSYMKYQLFQGLTDVQKQNKTRWSQLPSRQ